MILFILYSFLVAVSLYVTVFLVPDWGRKQQDTAVGRSEMQKVRKVNKTRRTTVQERLSSKRPRVHICFDYVNE